MADELFFPFRDKSIGTTTDSMHFQAIDLSKEVLIPLPQHPGAFGVTRKYHVHEGVDLYCIEREPVYALETGIVVSVTPFTGPHAGTPWWRDTWCVMVEGAHGVVNYGELIPRDTLRVGDTIHGNDLVGEIVMVLKEDKGRPRNMLHLELYQPGSNSFVEWDVGAPIPQTLRDPTRLLKAAAGISE